MLRTIGSTTMTSGPIELIIFDCDGTLVDSEPINNQAVSEVLQAHGLPQFTPSYCLEHFTGISLSNLILHVETMVATTLPKETLIRAFFERGHQLAKESLQATKQTKHTLEKINHKKCVASNNKKTAVLESLRITGLLDFFHPSSIFTPEQVNYGKPAPDLFLFAAATLKVSPSSCLVIEDSPAGIQAAKAAGMRVVAYTGGTHNQILTQHEKLRKHNPDGFIAHMSEILLYL